MYQTAAQSGGVLAMTGAATVCVVVGAWTLLVAGLALVMTARVLAHRARAGRR